MDATGALDSLLGRLTTVLVNEAQLLGRVRGDVEFIKDEMESMNGLILHLTEAQHRDHQVRAWMKQVVGLTRDCEGNVELYVHYVGSKPGDDGFLGYIRRIPRFLRTMPVRHRIATRIQELKVRARDVGDRRKRYGVIVPQAEPQQRRLVITTDLLPVPQPGGPEEEEDLRRRELLFGEPPDTIEEGTRKVLGWLSEADKPIWISIVGEGPAGKTAIARTVYNHPSVLSSFKHRAWVRFCRVGKHLVEVAQDILDQLDTGRHTATSTNEKIKSEDILGKLRDYLLLRGKMCLIVLDDLPDSLGYWEGEILSLFALHDSSCTIICTCNISEAKILRSLDIFSSHWDQYYVFSVLEEGTRPWFFRRRALALTNRPEYAQLAITRWCHDGFALQMLLHLFYVNPNLFIFQLESSQEMELWTETSIAKGMLMFCYNHHLPINYKSCLLYMSIFPQGHTIRRTSLLRRWIAEGLIAERRTATEKDKARYGIWTLQDQAERIFDALVTRGFLRPVETSTSGKIRTCTMNHIVHEFITTDVNIVDTCLPPHLAHRLSVNGGAIALQESPSSENGASDNETQTLLESMPQSSQWQLLKVLDLEGCTGLKNNKHLRNICKILLLRYLSLRNTDIIELPKQIQKLQCLETLDIRQTAIRASSTKSIMFPMLKYFLAGHTISPGNISDRFEESFETVRIPRGIGRMKKLEVMSHVEVSGNVDVLMDIGRLLQLRKLGVVLHVTEGVLNLLFQQIEKLHSCLRSLSIRINQETKSGSSPDAEVVPDLVNPPRLLETLNICGLKSGLPHWIADLDRLFKITLQDTSVGEDAIHILGKLRLLRCLRLLYKSYTESKLHFKADEFQLLRFLVIEARSIMNISFADGAAPKLELIVWPFGPLDALAGVNHLRKLKKLELIDGNYSLEQIMEAQMKDHPNHPELNHSPEHQHQEDVAAGAASSSSAP